MPFFTPGSSEQPIRDASQIKEVEDKLAALAADEPLPHDYGRDRIRLLAQSPYRLYAYWEFARDPFETLRRMMPARAAEFHLAIRLIEVETGRTTFHTATPARNYWFEAHPDRSYSAQVGFLDSSNLFIRLLTSVTARTPRATVAARRDSSNEFKVSSADFARVLERAGYTADAIEVALEAADEELALRASERIAAALTDVPLPELSPDERAEARGVFAALATGVSIEDLISQVSPSLAEWLRLVMAGSYGSLTAERIIQLLRELFGIEATAVPIFADLHHPARIVLGASEVHMPAPPSRLWMPSMIRGSQKRSS
jgi:hypothetical protein